MKVLSLSADGDLIIPDEEETKNACNHTMEAEAAEKMEEWRAKYPRPKQQTSAPPEHEPETPTSASTDLFRK